MTNVSTSRPVSTRRGSARETGRRMHLPPTGRTGPQSTHAFLNDLLGDDVHATRVLSLANGVVGVMHAASLGIHAIGRGLADALDLDPKHAIKQVDPKVQPRPIKVRGPITPDDAKRIALDIGPPARAVVRAAERHGIATPMTRTLHRLISLAQQRTL